MGSHITVHGLSKNQQGDSQRPLIAGSATLRAVHHVPEPTEEIFFDAEEDPQGLGGDASAATADLAPKWEFRDDEPSYCPFCGAAPLECVFAPFRRLRCPRCHEMGPDATWHH